MAKNKMIKSDADRGAAVFLITLGLLTVFGFCMAFGYSLTLFLTR